LVLSWIEATVAFLTRRSSIDKDDLASESFIALHDSLSRGLYHGQGLRSYIQRICTHKFLDQLRENRRTVGSDQHDIAELPAKSPTADDAARQILLNRRLRDALLQLSEKDRLAVLLWNSGSKPPEIAARLETTEGAVRKRVCLAIKKLRATMDKDQKH
jgi:RNA polymerase sigma factor (sigma-70 family)